MLTAKENLRETLKPDGHPDRFVNFRAASAIRLKTERAHWRGQTRFEVEARRPAGSGPA